MIDGADGIEFDVRLARDGVPVVIHDATLERTGMIVGRVADLSSAVLQQVDVGSWYHSKRAARLETPVSRSSRASDSKFRGEKLPSLA